MSLPRRVRVRGKVWRVREVPGLAKGHAHGECDAPDVKGKEIRIATRLKPAVALETFIHEMLHAACWDLSEETVFETARDVARELLRWGWSPPGEA